MTPFQTDMLADNLGMVCIGDLKNLGKEEVELAIEYYNSGLKGTSDVKHSIRNPMVPKRIQALVHKIKMWDLAGEQLLPSDWASPLQAAQGVDEMNAFETNEKNKTAPTEFPAEMQANKMKTDSEKLFVMMKATLELITSSDGLTSIAFLMKEST
jgi:hypothetical protein